MNSEPTVTITAITTLVGAVFAALVAFGLDISADQQTAILSLIAAAWVVVTPIWIRSKVWAPDSVEDIVDKAHVAGTRGQATPKV